MRTLLLFSKLSGPAGQVAHALLCGPCTHRYQVLFHFLHSIIFTILRVLQNSPVVENPALLLPLVERIDFILLQFAPWSSKDPVWVACLEKARLFRCGHLVELASDVRLISDDNIIQVLVEAYKRDHIALHALGKLEIVVSELTFHIIVVRSIG